MKHFKFIPLLLILLLLLCGCGNESVSEKNGIPCFPWPEREDGAEPFVHIPEKKSVMEMDNGWRDNLAHTSSRKRETALDRIQAKPEGELSEFLVFPKDSDNSGDWPENEEYKLFKSFLDAEEAYREIEDKGSDDAMKAQEKVKTAFAQYNDYFNKKDLDLNMKLAERFVEAGCYAKVMAEEYVQYGNTARNCIVIVKTTPENFLQLIKTVDGVLSADVCDEMTYYQFATLIWEGEP